MSRVDRSWSAYKRAAILSALMLSLANLVYGRTLASQDVIVVNTPNVNVANAATARVCGAWIPCEAGPGETALRQDAHGARRVSPDEARPFLGEWASLVEGPAGPANFVITIRVEEGRVLATVNSDLMGENTVEDIRTTDRGIALRFTRELWGYSGLMVLLLASDGDHLRADFSIMNGWFTFGGVATRRRGA